MRKSNRLIYIDNIRIFLTVIVVLHHLAITYGAPGGWYYREFELHDLDSLSLALLVFFAASNQAYFMGFFFFLGGLFSGKSIKKYGPQKFIVQRVFRLGIPMILFVYIVSPALRLVLWHKLYKTAIRPDSLITIYQNLDFGIELGPMWFVMFLLILSIMLSIIHSYESLSISIPKIHLSHWHIILFAISIGVITFMIRISQPIGTVFQPINLQIPFALQYISLFFVGYLTCNQGWLDQLDKVNSKSWGVIVVILILLMPLIYFVSGGLEGDLTPALGGFHWQSALYSIWEQFFCLSVMILILSFAKNKLNHSGRISQELSLSSYATFFIHPLILVTLTVFIKDLTFTPLFKISLTAVPALSLCFLAGCLLRYLPGLRSIL